MTAAASPWAWHAHPDVWAVMGALLVGYVVARRHWAPAPGELQVQRRKAVWFGLGLLAARGSRPTGPSTTSASATCSASTCSST